MRDTKNNVKVLNALDIQAISSDTTTNGDWIDLQGHGSCTFDIQSGTLTDGTYTPLVQDADASDQSDAAAVADVNLIGTEASAAFDADDDNTVKTIGYAGVKRYVRLSLVSASTTSGGTLGATVRLAHSNVLPKA